jgi:hypothetical protein
MFSSKDYITAALEHRKLDRIPMCETAIWPETIARWQSEGMPEDADPIDYFGFDSIIINHPFGCGFFDYQILEETDDMITDLSPFGTTIKYYKKSNSSSGWQELDHKVKKIEDWRNVRSLVDKYGDQTILMGNINADILAKGNKSEIEDEIASKIIAAKKSGGYIYHIDHSVPPTVSFETYSFAIEQVKKYGVY